MADRTTVMSWLEGLAQDDWMMFHSDSEVQEIARSALALLKQQEADREFYAEKCDELYAVAKSRTEVVRCKDCNNRECDGRAGTIVCGITGFSHSRLWYCADGERRDDEEE